MENILFFPVIMKVMFTNMMQLLEIIFGLNHFDIIPESYLQGQFEYTMKLFMFHFHRVNGLMEQILIMNAVLLEEE